MGQKEQSKRTATASTAQHSTAQPASTAHSTAQHSDCAFFSTVHIHKRKRIKASINMYMDKMYVFSGAFSV
ncbi:MAG: hypothetical protein ACLUD5_13780 [Agathobacter rectalis]